MKGTTQVAELSRFSTSTLDWDVCEQRARNVALVLANIHGGGRFWDKPKELPLRRSAQCL